jgi:hypothetical protein
MDQLSHLGISWRRADFDPSYSAKRISGVTRPNEFPDARGTTLKLFSNTLCNFFTTGSAKSSKLVVEIDNIEDYTLKFSFK